MKKARRKGWGGKRRGAGRPPTGNAPAFSTRLPPELVAVVDQYARARGISRSEAIRFAVGTGLRAGHLGD
jgi:hypothetical protein